MLYGYNLLRNQYFQTLSSTIYSHYTKCIWPNHTYTLPKHKAISYIHRIKALFLRFHHKLNLTQTARGLNNMEPIRLKCHNLMYSPLYPSKEQKAWAKFSPRFYPMTQQVNQRHAGTNINKSTLILLYTTKT